MTAARTNIMSNATKENPHENSQIEIETNNNTSPAAIARSAYAVIRNIKKINTLFITENVFLLNNIYIIPANIKNIFGTLYIFLIHLSVYALNASIEKITGTAVSVNPVK